MSDSGNDSTRGEKLQAGAEDEADNQGNRDNLINTLCRVCTANGYQRGAVYVDAEFHEVELAPPPTSAAAASLAPAPRARPASWALDDSLDSVPSPARQQQQKQQQQQQQQQRQQRQQQRPASRGNKDISSTTNTTGDGGEGGEGGGEGGGSDPPPDVFAPQAAVFAKLQQHCLRRFHARSRAITVVALGPSGGGKSYRCGAARVVLVV